MVPYPPNTPGEPQNLLPMEEVIWHHYNDPPVHSGKACPICGKYRCPIHQMRTCPTCGKRSLRKHQYCGNCIPIRVCEECGKEFRVYAFRRFCSTCAKIDRAKRAWIREKERRKDEKNQHDLKWLAAQAILDKCRLDGTCSVLKAHHEILSSDPERLRTEFLIKMTCGLDGLHRYYRKEGIPS